MWVAILATLIFAPFSAPSAITASCTKDNYIVNDGVCWRSLSQIEKGAVEQGLWVGLSTRRLADHLIDDEASYFFDKDWAGTAPSSTVGDITSYFDKLYETAANRVITWDWAYILAGMSTRDDDDNDRLALLKFIREFGTLPTTGEIIGAVDEEHISIRSGERTFEIKIAGVSGEGLSADEKGRARNFLNGLRHSRDFLGSCRQRVPYPVTLVYSRDVFGLGNELTANVRLRDYNPICLGESEVDLENMTEYAGQFVDLSYFLLSNGLLKPDAYREDRWPKETVDSRDYEYAAKQGEEKGLYLYGNATTDAIDRIIAYGSTPSVGTDLQDSAEDSSAASGDAIAKSGSGFFVTTTVAVTNAHVVSGCESVSASGPDRLMREGRVLASDTANDLALIRFDSPFPNAATVEFGAGRPVKVGDPIFLAGYPLSGLLASGVSVADGVVRNNAGIGDDIRMMQVTAPVQPGNSGGPILNREGILVGVVTSKLDAIAVAHATGDIPQNVNFAIKSSVVLTMLDAYEVEYDAEPDGLEEQETVYDRLKRVSIYIQCG